MENPAINSQLAIAEVAYEKKFTEENTWRNFKMSLFGAISGATFFGLLANVAGMLLTAVGGGDVAFQPFASTAVMAGLATVGVAAAYLGVREGTEIKKLQDEHLARKHALAQELCKTQGICNQPEYPEQQRGDGKSWQQTVTDQSPTQIGQRLH